MSRYESYELVERKVRADAAEWRRTQDSFRGRPEAARREEAPCARGGDSVPKEVVRCTFNPTPDESIIMAFYCGSGRTKPDPAVPGDRGYTAREIRHMSDEEFDRKHGFLAGGAFPTTSRSEHHSAPPLLTLRVVQFLWSDSIFHEWRAVIVKRFLKSLSIKTNKGSDKPPKLQIVNKEEMYKTLRGHSNKRLSRFLQFLSETVCGEDLCSIVQLLQTTAFQEPSLAVSTKYWIRAAQCSLEGGAF